MKSKFLFLFLYIFLGMLVEWASMTIHSDYLHYIYKGPFFAVMVTMTIFSFTLFSYISSKISEIEKEYKFSFQNVRLELKESFQLLTIFDIIILILLILRFSDLSNNNISSFVLNSGLNTMFFSMIHILIDLGKSIFEMFETLGDINSGKYD